MKFYAKNLDDLTQDETAYLKMEVAQAVGFIEQKYRSKGDMFLVALGIALRDKAKPKQRASAQKPVQYGSYEDES